MRNLIVISLTVIMVLIAGFSFAQTGTLNLKDLEGLSSATRNEFVKNKLKEFKSTSALSNLDPEKAEKWAKIISTTIRTISQDLAVSVNDFVKTDVGKVTMFLIVYKVIGDDIRHIVLGMLGWFMTSLILIISFRHFHGSKKFKIKDDKGNVTDIKYVPKFKWATDADGGSDAKLASGGLHAAMFIAITILAWMTVVV